MEAADKLKAASREVNEGTLRSGAFINHVAAPRLRDPI